MEKKCQHCGKTFTVYPSHGDKKFCSKKCSTESLRKALAEKMVEKICPVCGEKFYVIPCYANRVFCSKQCFKKGIKLPDITKHCSVCGKSFTTKDPYKEICSLPCAKLSLVTKESSKIKRNLLKESKWWTDECPFHNGQISEEYQKNMCDWYFI